MVHAVDAHSNKSALIPPPQNELERLAQRAQAVQSDAAANKAIGALMRSLRRRLAPPVIAELVARYRAGEDTPALSQEYGISKTGLRDLLQAEGVAMRRKAITSGDTNRAVQLYEGGLTIDQVAERSGYSYGTVRRALHEKNVVMRAGSINGHRRIRDQGG